MGRGGKLTRFSHDLHEVKWKLQPLLISDYKPANLNYSPRTTYSNSSVSCCDFNLQVFLWRVQADADQKRKRLLSRDPTCYEANERWKSGLHHAALWVQGRLLEWCSHPNCLHSVFGMVLWHTLWIANDQVCHLMFFCFAFNLMKIMNIWWVLLWWWLEPCICRGGTSCATWHAWPYLLFC